MAIHRVVDLRLFQNVATLADISSSEPDSIVRALASRLWRSADEGRRARGVIICRLRQNVFSRRSALMQKNRSGCAALVAPQLTDRAELASRHTTSRSHPEPIVSGSSVKRARISFRSRCASSGSVLTKMP